MLNTTFGPILGTVKELITDTTAAVVLRGKILEANILATMPVAVGDLVYLAHIPSTTQYIIIGICVEVGDLLWIVYTDTTSEILVRQAEMVGDLTAKSLAWTSDPIAIPFDDTLVNCVASHEADTCFVSTVKTTEPHNIKLYKVVASTLTATEVFTHDTEDELGSSDGEILKIWPYTAPDMWFCVWRLSLGSGFDNSLHGLWKSTDSGNTWSFVHRGWDRSVELSNNPSVHDFAVGSTGPQSGRIYTVHENTYNGSVINPDNVRCCLSYSDDSGATWTDVLNTLSVLSFPSLGWYGYISLYPKDNGSEKVYYSIFEEAGHIGTHYYVPGVGPTLHNFTEFAANGGIDVGYYLTADRRLFLAEDLTSVPAWLSTDAGANWSDAAFDDIVDYNIDEHEHLYSMNSKDWFVIRPGKDTGDPEPTASIALSTELGIWQDVPLPDLPPETYVTAGVTFVNGRY